jgi:calcium-dependent protein kinase
MPPTDLKLENFLFSSQHADSELRMIDFGLSKHFISGQFHDEQVGTPYTVAPEIISGRYDEKSDMWALGVIAYLLLSGVTPFGGLDGESLLLVKQNIMRAKLEFEPAELWENVSQDAVEFLKRLLQADPNNRPNAKRAQKDPWIQVWAKKDAKAGNKLNPKTIGALMAFKEQSDMQKLLSEVLSFTLLPEQIVDLRVEFEKIDSDGDGEISLHAMKNVLMANAEVGALGALTEQEVESLFDAIRVRKTEPTIRWHEFLAAGLSQARVDDRNLRLAFDRIDTHHKGYVTLSDLRDMLGNSAEAHVLERTWLESLNECKAHLDRITFVDFKRLMKGQPKTKDSSTRGQLLAEKTLEPVPEDHLRNGESLEGDMPEGHLPEAEFIRPHKRSHSFDHTSPLWASEGNMNYHAASDDASLGSSTSLGRDASRAVLITNFDAEERRASLKTIPLTTPSKESPSPLVLNRVLYRKHREMRISILEASKQFDQKRKTLQASQAGLIMKRGAKAPDAMEDKHAREMFEAAAKRCGRARRSRNKTVSDVTGMMMQVEEKV